jgi:hypothetical protein
MKNSEKDVMVRVKKWNLKMMTNRSRICKGQICMCEVVLSLLFLSKTNSVLTKKKLNFFLKL